MVQSAMADVLIEAPKTEAVKRRLRLYAGERPALFSMLCRLMQNRRAVRPDTQLVIEGFPRSANTFSVWAFKLAQHEEVRMAHHLHYPAQVVRAVQWRIPTLVLIRKPEDAVMSWLMRDPQPVDQALKHYISFYGTIKSHREAYVVGSFEEVTKSYGSVIERINDRFGTRFSIFHHTEENMARVYSRIEEMHRTRNGGKVSETRIARPSAAKEEMRSRIKPSLEAPSQRKLLAEATTLYEHFTAR